MHFEWAFAWHQRWSTSDASVSDYVTDSHLIIRHRISEWEYLVEKKGSKICAMVASSMPEPSSVTSRKTKSPGRTSNAGAWRPAISGDTTEGPVTISIRPSVWDGIASAALMTKFIRICSIWLGSAWMIRSSCESRNTRFTLLGMEADRSGIAYGPK